MAGAPPTMSIQILPATSGAGEAPLEAGDNPGLSKLGAFPSTMICGSAARCAERLRLSEGRAS